MQWQCHALPFKRLAEATSKPDQLPNFWGDQARRPMAEKLRRFVCFAGFLTSKFKKAVYGNGLKSFETLSGSEEHYQACLIYLLGGSDQCKPSLPFCIQKSFERDLLYILGLTEKQGFCTPHSLMKTGSVLDPVSLFFSLS